MAFDLANLLQGQLGDVLAVFLLSSANPLKAVRKPPDWHCLP